MYTHTQRERARASERATERTRENERLPVRRCGGVACAGEGCAHAWHENELRGVWPPLVTRAFDALATAQLSVPESRDQRVHAAAMPDFHIPKLPRARPRVGQRRFDLVPA